MKLSLTYQDLRKIGAVFRRPGIAILECRSGETGVEVDVRVDVSQFVDAVQKIRKTMPIVLKAEFELQVLDGRRCAVRLAGLRLDKSEIPLLARPFFNKKTARKLIFKAIKPKPGIVVQHDEERVMCELQELLPEPFTTATLHRLDSDSFAVNLHLNLST